MAEIENVQISELRDRNDAELRSLVASKRDDLQKVKFKQALGQLDKPHLLKILKKDIARIQTVLNERTAASEG